MEYIKKIFINFVELTRAYAFWVTLASFLVIYSYASYSEHFTNFNFVIMLIAILCVHFGANLFDDIIDVKSKLKETNDISNIKFHTFKPKARLLIDGTFSMKEATIIALSLFLIAFIIGIYFIFTTTFNVAYYMLAGVVLTLFYPISAKYYLNEFTIALIYGPLTIMGGYLALSGEFSLNLLIYSLAIMCSTSVLLHTDNIMDWEYDVQEGKKTIALLIGNKEKALKSLSYLIMSAYLIVVFGVLFSIFNPHMLYAFLTLPIATKLLRSMKDYIDVKDVELKPRWYYGFFEGWEVIKKRKIEFYMYRFYLARNFAFFFALFSSFGAMVNY